MKTYTLITGASTGIGYEIAWQLAGKNQNLILVARSTEKLLQIQQELTSKHGISVEILTRDLSEVSEAVSLYEEVKDRGMLVNGLINNAGSGIYGDFTETSLYEELKMINLNVSALVVLTKLYGADMAARGEGRIMNVASLLSFFHFPYYAVYSATKAFVLAFSQTIASELEEKGVIVTALCPGPVDTPFNTSEMLSTKAYKTNKPASPEIVAKAGVELFMNGKGTKLVGWKNWLIAQLPRITPSFILMKIKMNLAGPQPLKSSL
ncbi:SDR family oxidoreductase [Inquilinus sp. KBS0705]|nr:SDR family oxidoreductase [Inquilinus sp. KBS0705]